MHPPRSAPSIQQGSAPAFFSLRRYSLDLIFLRRLALACGAARGRRGGRCGRHARKCWPVTVLAPLRCTRHCSRAAEGLHTAQPPRQPAAQQTHLVVEEQRAHAGQAVLPLARLLHRQRLQGGAGSGHAVGERRGAWGSRLQGRDQRLSAPPLVAHRHAQLARAPAGTCASPPRAAAPSWPGPPPPRPPRAPSARPPPRAAPPPPPPCRSRGGAAPPAPRSSSRAARLRAAGGVRAGRGPPV